jgi:hypothetical protein
MLSKIRTGRNTKPAPRAEKKRRIEAEGVCVTDGQSNSGQWDRLAPSMREPLRRLVNLIRELAGRHLIGVTAYGPVVGSSFDNSSTSATSVMVLGEIDLDVLRRLSEHGPKLGKDGITAPLVMTPPYIAASTDSFPLELLEIHLRRATLFGADHFEKLDIQPDHMRLQCEREFKRILIRLRQGLLAAAGRDRVLAEIEVDVGRHLLRTLRGLLWLKDKKDMPGDEAAVTEVENLAGASLAGLRAALRVPGDHGWDAFTSLYADVEMLAALANED